MNKTGRLDLASRQASVTRRSPPFVKAYRPGGTTDPSLHPALAGWTDLGLDERRWRV